MPGEDGRPCFRVLDDWTDHEGRRLRPGLWHFDIRPGRGDAPPSLVNQWVCSPLHIDAVSRAAHGGDFGRLLRFCDTLGRWHTWAMPMELLAGDGVEVRAALLQMGLEVDPARPAREALSRYLQQRPPRRTVVCTHQTGWADATHRAYILPDAVIGEGAAGFVYQAAAAPVNEYTQAGTLDGWRAGVAAMAPGNPVLLLSLSLAFSGPLLYRVGAESGGLHLVGDSSTGKTSALSAACSVWGGEGFRRSWRATSNGIEGAAAMFNDSLLALDEISECDPREVGQTIYALGNGRGKQRAGRTGLARPVATWRSAVLSSGERTIETAMMEGGRRPNAGLAVRLVDLPVASAHGAWDALHAQETGRHFSEQLKREAALNHGHAGRAFLERLTRDSRDLGGMLDAIKARPELQTDSSDGQPRRVAGRFAVIALAGELATHYGLTGWNQGDAVRAACWGFGRWLQHRPGQGANAELAQIVGQLADFIDRHGQARFARTDGSDGHLVRDRAGWRDAADEDSDTVRPYLFSPAGLREALRGHDFMRAAGALASAGALVTIGDGKHSVSRRIDGQQRRVYAVNPAALGDQQGA